MTTLPSNLKLLFKELSPKSNESDCGLKK